MASIAKNLGYQYRVLILLSLVFLAIRIPFRAEFLVNWDSVNFALGTQFFNLENHQPHPPGYIGYVALGWLLNHLTGDANVSLTSLSIVSGALAPVAFYLLASQFIRRRYAIVTAALFGLSPVVWYYSDVALTYSVEAALALFFLWLGFRARQATSLRFLVAATVFLVLLGAMRQSGALFLIPLWLYLAWGFPWRQRLTAGGVFVLGSLAWLVPLLWLSGGFAAYLRASTGLAKLAVMPTSIFAMNPLSMSQNIGFVFMGVVVGVNLGLLIIVAALFRRVNPFAVFAQHRMFFVLWLVPALLTYLLLHTGQLGYVLLILPAIFLPVGAAIAGLDAQRRQAASQAPIGQRSFAQRYAIAGLVVLLALGNTGTFLFAPHVVYGVASSDEPGGAKELTSELFDSLPLFRVAKDEEGTGAAFRARQYNLRLNDQHWTHLIAFADKFDPETTAVLTVPYGAGSFRHLTYYLPDHRVYGIGRDLEGSYGHLFTAHEGTSDYAVEGLEKARRELVLPPDIRRLLIPDSDVYRHIDGVESYVVELQSGLPVVVIRVPERSVLVFRTVGTDEVRIAVVQDGDE